MHPEFFDHLLLLASVVCAVTLVRLVRRGDSAERGYAILVGGLLLTSVLALGQAVFVGAAAIAATGFTVGLPWLLEHGSRWAFARGHLTWTARLGIARAMVMPGAGLGRHVPILEGIAMVQTRGVDAALAHFRRLAHEAEDPVELGMIHEQIVAMLFHGQRWDEGIAHYERRFRPGYAALRPSLALGLLRAYGESGRLETAAGLLRALEDGPIGADPSTAELLGQARLTFLAYAGAVAPVDEFVEHRRFADLGLSAATAELFKGIAQARAGAPVDAAQTLRNVEDLAGPRDHRVLKAARDTLRDVRASTGSAIVELGPELRSYVELVGGRLREFMAAPRAVRRSDRTWVTHFVVGVCVLVYAIHVIGGGGGVGLLEVGALAEDLWRVGSWGRVFTAAWIHVDLVGLLFDAYAIWLAGQLVERVLSPARMALATVGAAVAGMAASVVALPWLWQIGLDSAAIVGATGGNLLAVGGCTAGLWLLSASRTPMIASRARRNLVVTLALLLAANVIMNWPGAIGFGTAPVALLTTMAVASLIALAPSQRETVAGRVTEAVAKTALAGLAAATLVAAALVFGEDPERVLVDRRTWTCEVQGVEVRTPTWFVEHTLDRDAPFELPIVDGLVDGLELRDGGLVQLTVLREPAAPGVGEGLTAILGSLGVTAATGLPEPFAAKLAADGRHWRAFDAWRNGERVARVVARDLDARGPSEQPARVVLLVTPAEALAHAPELWLAILADAKLVGEPGGRTTCRVD